MILFIGPTGVGKSEQASLLEAQGLAHWVSTGKLLREFLVGEDKAKLDQGELVPSSTVTQLIKSEMQKQNDSKPIILDGFPRRVEQVDWLFSNDNQYKPTVAVWLEAERSVLFDRLIKRQRVDDQPDIINHRLDLYKNEIAPIVSRMEENNLPIIKIDSNRTVAEVNQDIVSKLKEMGLVHADKN